MEGVLPEGPWRLAPSAWPRSGGCQRGSRNTPAVGPRQGTLREILSLPGEPNPTRHRYARSGVATAEDGFRVTSRRKLFALDPEGQLRWQTPMLGKSARYESAPLILAGDLTVVALDQHLVFVNALGERVAAIHLGGDGLDDTGHSPNLADGGQLVVTGPLREVALVGADGLAHSLGKHGLDIAPPAVTEAGLLAVAGFGADGLVLLDPASGQVRARGADGNVDQMPTVGADGTIAVGSSLGTGWLLDSAGQTLATVEAQAFAALPGGWRALSYGALRALDGAGTPQWEAPMGDGFEVGWHLRLVVDADAFTYVPLQRSVVCVDPSGRRVFEVETPERPTDLAPLGDGRMAVVTAARVLLLE